MGHRDGSMLRLPDGWFYVEHYFMISPPDCMPFSAAALLQWTGSEFGLPWVAYMDGIYFTRISPSGEKIGSDIRFTQIPVPERIDAPSIRWTGTEYGMAWAVGAVGPEIHFSRVSSTGEWLGTDTTIGVTDLYTDPALPIEWTGSAFGLLRGEHADVTYPGRRSSQ